ncbi:cryptochrome/photolyase family protein [Aporhodopirellula aestuarii]|uniref:Cryptochrome/photolyase family protein n=1 Tax=Aporhodopirellula aestuarii TaxID=2950107 RepID=A0ABT0UDQ7_9BACT|nr:cryptochrome/photolyase family protein [Aporhodopirellula aestuarii]MCM2375184.1 cryptochrome/photolyase family protein [Aporhodopirellula aestuarii]
MFLLVFPNQLFCKHPGLKRSPSRVLLIEDSLFFGDSRYPMPFHKQKLWLHRASMKRYEVDLRQKGHEVQYVEYHAEHPNLDDQLHCTIKPNERDGETICCVDPTDFILEKRIRRTCAKLEMEVEFLPNPGFLNTPEENQEYRAGKNRWFMADFYKWQRQRLDVLMDGDEPAGGQWSFDEDNRKKIPKKQLASIPDLSFPKRDQVDLDAREYVEREFPSHPGGLETLYYPTSHASARRWLKQFLKQRFEYFGAYEDAIVEGESWLWHSVLTPVLNIGLLTPDEIIKETLRYTGGNEVPLNSVEGFVRQIIGWREFMRATYEDLGVPMRTTNHWQHHRAMPSSFYDATTGIIPIDDTISRILKTGYCHHIERLMVLGGFMFLCEIDPDDIYRWFMEMFIDSYDWVMVPNVYAMSQNADGGAITTKPYFSGSSYIRKMSHYPRQPWCDTWDGLYWRWIWNHVDELGKNPRWAMMCSMAKKMEPEKREQHLANAEAFLESLG